MTAENDYQELYQQEFDKYWWPFKISMAYEELAHQFPTLTDAFQIDVELIIRVITQDRPVPVTQWRFEDVESGIHQIIRLHQENKASGLMAYLPEFLMVSRSWFEWLVEIEASPISIVSISKIFQPLFVKYQRILTADKSETELTSVALVENEPSYDYQAEARQRAQTTFNAELKQWVTEFKAAPTWRASNKQHSVEFIQTFIITLANNIYATYHKTPRTWTKTAIQGVLKTDFVTTMPYQADEVPMLAQLLQDFLSFEGAAGYLRQDLVVRLKRAVTEIMPEVKQLYAQPGNFEADKRLVIDMMAAGVDLSDKAAISRFVADQRLSQQAARAAAGFPGEYKMLYHPKAKYQTLKHVASTKTGKYSKATATRVHNELVRLAWRLWSERPDWYHDFEQPEIMDIIIDFGDLLYAQHLLTIKGWQPEVFRVEVPRFLAGKGLVEKSLFQIVWGALIESMYEKGKIDLTLYATLITTIGGSLSDQPPLTGGKKIGLKHWQRQKKSKKRKRR
ncbi:MAG: hypothetical protein LKF36_14280 [Lactobacillus sp.]|jgi:hypothetical protein|nr:hypothetical protein [Lactobacillus sp.]